MSMTRTPEAQRIRFGTNVREARLNLGLTQMELALGLEVWLQTVQRWEAGESYPTPRRLHAISEALGVSIQQLREEVRDGDAASDD